MSDQTTFAELLATAVAYDAAGQQAEAEDLLAGLRAIDPGHVEVNARLGILLATRGAFAEAIPPLETAVAAAPAHALLRNVLSVCVFETGDHASALVHAEAAVGSDPSFAAAHNSRGNALHRMGRNAEALESFRDAERLEPNDPVAHVNIANALRYLDRPAEALASVDRALALAPGLAPAHANRGDVLQDLMRHADAVASYDQAIALDPGSVDANWNRSLALLLTGRFGEGWRGYEWRWQGPNPASPPRGLTTPLWLGETPIAGRSILLHAEQGLGDAIQFVRYAPAVAALGGEVVLEVHPALVDLFRSLGDVPIIPRGAALPATDFQTPLMSLPLALGETGPPAEIAAYLAPPPERMAVWRPRAPFTGPLKVGLVATGNPNHGNDRRRSLPFEILSPYLPRGFEYHLLQKEIAPRDAEAIQARDDVRVWCDQFGDLADTAALAAQLDVVISVDTSIAHLSGAIGQETWVLLAYDPDWRWGLHTDRTPWYPSARLYRQAVRDDWSVPLARVREDLMKLAAEA